MNVFKRLARWFNKPEPIEEAQQGIFHSSAPWWRHHEPQYLSDEELKKKLAEIWAQQYPNRTPPDPEEVEVGLVDEMIREEKKF